MGSASLPFGDITPMEAARRQLGMSTMDVWVGYFAVGGNGTFPDVGDWLSSAVRPPPREHDMLAQALNDRYTEVGLDHPVRYSDGT